MKEVYLLAMLMIMLFVMGIKACTFVTYDSCLPYNPTIEQIKECEKVLK